MCWYGLTNLIIRADHEYMVTGDKTIVSVDPDMDETDYCRGCSPNCITIRGVTITYLFIHHYFIRHTHYHHELRVCLISFVRETPNKIIILIYDMINTLSRKPFLIHRFHFQYLHSNHSRLVKPRVR
jgi:hypothetical protein